MGYSKLATEWLSFNVPCFTYSLTRSLPIVACGAFRDWTLCMALWTWAVGHASHQVLCRMPPYMDYYSLSDPGGM